MKPTPPSDRPHVLVNMAMTADGKIATANRRVSTFGSPADEENLYRLRSTVDAVMNGARTADLNPITMDPGEAKWRRARLRRGLAEYNLRVVVSGSGTLDLGARIFQDRFSPLLILTGGRVPKARLAALQRAATAVFSDGEDRAVDFPAALRWLKREWGVKRLLCEGGGALNDALFRADLVDELHLTLCPFVVGGRAAPTIADGVGFARLAEAVPLRLHRRKANGPELFLTFRRKNPAAREDTPPKG
jgi:riboflavin-specific deaminase-like protein